MKAVWDLLFSRSRCHTDTARRRARPHLEALEMRWLPAPVAQNDSLITEQDHALFIEQSDLLRNDADATRAELVSQPANGEVLTRADGGFVYNPRAGFTGTDTFTYRAVKDNEVSAAATVTMTVFPLGMAPGAANPGGGSNTGGTNAGGTNTGANTHAATIRILRGPTVQAKAASSFRGVVGSFRSTAAPRATKALINWGDGTTSRGTVVSSRGQLRVLGTHAFRSAGVYRLVVTVHTGAGQFTQLQGRAVVAGTPVPRTGAQIAALSALRVSGVIGRATAQTYAQFRVTGGSARPSAFRALIDWGDGSATFGKITVVRGRFRVNGSHAYQLPGTYPVEITVVKAGRVARVQGSTRIAAMLG
jgi:hypothetical protein